MTEESPLLKTIKKWINDNGGAKVLSDIIISENHDIFTHEAVKADRRLKNKGILSYDDIKPFKKPKRSRELYSTVEKLYYTHTFIEIAQMLKKPTSYIRQISYTLAKEGKLNRISRKHPNWTNEEDDYIKKHGHYMRTEDIAKHLSRTKLGVQARKKHLRITLDMEHRIFKGRTT